MRKFIIFLLNTFIGKPRRILQKVSLVQAQSGERIWGDGKALTLWDSLYSKALAETTEYVSNNLENATYFKTRSQMFEWIREQVQMESDADSKILLEFGVYTGISINEISNLFPKNQVYGFDSFLGLEENWTGFNLPAATFSIQGRIPKVNGNVTLIAGWFSDSLPTFVSKLRGEKKSILLIHMDADTFTPTKLVLEQLIEFIDPQTYIVFDEYYNYPGWKNHEWKAWQEFIQESPYDYEYIAFSETSVAVRLSRVQDK
jgi:hypothetical protein